MRILYDHQAFSLQNLGGITVYYYELAARLSRLPGVRVDVGLGLNRCYYPFPTRGQPALHIFGSSTTLPAGLKRYAINEAIVGAWSLTQGNWDIYHSTLYRRMPTVRSRRIVATNHDCTQDRYPELFPNPRRVTDAKRKLYAQCDAIFCVSEFSRRDLLHYYDVDPAITYAIHQGFPRLRRCPEAASEFVGSLRKPFLLFVGARYAYKNFEGLLEAFAAGAFANDYDLVVIGGGAFTEAELRSISRLRLQDHVLLYKEVNDAVLAEAYSRAALFVSPSRYEGFGLPPLEALSLRCTVLASNTASIPEICGDAAYYFNPEVPGDLERGMRDALNAGDRAERAARGIERTSLYSWQKNADATFAVYEKLLR